MPFSIKRMLDMFGLKREDPTSLKDLESIFNAIKANNLRQYLNLADSSGQKVVDSFDSILDAESNDNALKFRQILRINLQQINTWQAAIVKLQNEARQLEQKIRRVGI